MIKINPKVVKDELPFNAKNLIKKMETLTPDEIFLLGSVII
jgi:hypothetical protein